MGDRKLRVLKPELQTQLASRFRVIAFTIGLRESMSRMRDKTMHWRLINIEELSPDHFRKFDVCCVIRITIFKKLNNKNNF